MTSGVKQSPPTALAARLRRIREDAGLTQARMAVRLKTGSSRICHWEIGRFEPGLPVLRRYAAFADVTLAELLDGVA